MRDRLGAPSASGEPMVVPPFGLMPAWDRFDRPDASVHVEYVQEGPGVRMVSLMSDPP